MGFLEEEIKKKKELEKYNMLVEVIHEWKEWEENPNTSPDFDDFMDELLSIVEGGGECISDVIDSRDEGVMSKEKRKITLSRRYLLLRNHSAIIKPFDPELTGFDWSRPVIITIEQDQRKEAENVE